MNQNPFEEMEDLKIDLAQYGIKESNYENVSDDSMSSMYDGTFRSVTENTIIQGRVVNITPTHVIVNVGYKSEGVLPREEFEDTPDLAIGDTVDVFLVSKEDEHGNIRLSKAEADRQRSWDETLEACKDGKPVKGIVRRKVKGGLMVDIGIEAFLPASQLSLQNTKNIDDYIGQELEVKVIKVNYERKNVVVSRRELLDEERSLKRRTFLDQVKVGDVRKGVVKNITDFGAFVDLSGIDGLLHLTDMRWGRINHPSEILEVGKEIDVMIIGIDYEKERVSLGIKQMTPNPWLDVDKKYPAGTVVEGKVVNLLPYGAFVELEEGLEGLIHISEFSWTRKVNHPSEFVQVGDVVKAAVLSIDTDDQKISLGLRQTHSNPWETINERYPIGGKIKGVVRNLTVYGAFVELEDGIDGLIHVSDMSWTRKINHPSEVLKKGETVEAVVLNINTEDRKIALGLKQLTEDPWDHIYDHYREGDTVTGKITNLTTFGAFIQLDNDIEGLIHISELSQNQVQNVKEVVQVGQEVTGKIVRIDPTDRKIAVSLKEYERETAPAPEPEEKPAEEEAPVSNEPKEPFTSGIDLNAVIQRKDK
ncbi:30S ribosomal protein S1 [bacterium]|nr:30S ribosomal protein S1 [bacterium]